MERDELVPNPWTAPGAPRASVSAGRPASCYGPVHGLILEGLLQDEARPVILEAVPVRDATVRDHDAGGRRRLTGRPCDRCPVDDGHLEVSDDDVESVAALHRRDGFFAGREGLDLV